MPYQTPHQRSLQSWPGLKLWITHPRHTGTCYISPPLAGQHCNVDPDRTINPFRQPTQNQYGPGSTSRACSQTASYYSADLLGPQALRFEWFPRICSLRATKMPTKLRKQPFSTPEQTSITSNRPEPTTNQQIYHHIPHPHHQTTQIGCFVCIHGHFNYTTSIPWYQIPTAIG